MSHESDRRINTYLDKLGALREENPPWNWDDQPAKLAMSPNILNDPAFSEYDLSNIRTYEQDPRLRDAITLGDRRTELEKRYDQAGDYGYTYRPQISPYDPDKVYIRDLDKLKMAVGPGAEQTKQGNINKEIASTIAHEFRHTMFDDPKYQGIIEAAYNKFGGKIPYPEINEMITRAAEAQLIPGDWDWAEFDIPESLEDYQKEYNWLQQQWTGRPEHLTPINTTKQFHQSAREFFEKVRRQKLKRPTQTNIQKRKIGMPEHLTTYTPPKKPYVTPPRGGGADIIQTPPPKKTYVSPARPHSADPPSGGGGQRGSNRGGFSDPGKGSYGPWKADGGLIDRPLPGRSRYI